MAYGRPSLLVRRVAKSKQTFPSPKIRVSLEFFLTSKI